MENEQQKEFTGVWIPRAVVEDERLTWTDRALYAEIACYNICWASNAFLAKRLSISESMVSKIIARLKTLKYVEEAGFNGRFRQLIARQGSNVLLGRVATDCEADSQCIARIDNSIENSKDNNTYTSDGAKIIKAFEDINSIAKRWYGNTTQRKAADELIADHGLRETLNVIELLPQTNAQRYFPTITSPAQLRDKWAQLAAAYYKQQSVTPNSVKI